MTITLPDTDAVALRTHRPCRREQSGPRRSGEPVVPRAEADRQNRAGRRLGRTCADDRAAVRPDGEPVTGSQCHWTTFRICTTTYMLAAMPPRTAR